MNAAIFRFFFYFSA
ncbi:pheST operon leader peptide PheM [Cronobacter sakazakii]|uniref:pheST attenuator peptide n=44 Tax=Enterobacterales TaxID=91347 RepID=A0A6I6KE46_ENTAG|nr:MULTISPECIES: pheST operon leader peptide PheM [Enterobacterales]EGQ5300107.1 pheST operon leader peptide PheM [Enterobacter hormaechei]KAF6663189.1 pheST operon leader peptide PheM [Enterobacteriaceae bacterium EKM102V]MBN5238416.1 pheST operon leader peptide PheM [Serratia marcescens]MCJ6248817.1 pheST operon leader peptide PheM [Klebsiella pneumoniae]MDY0925578.1 pheST operon leader peptide PheM [Enterobacter sp. CFBP8995]MRS21137.1 pheST operon leader peptide PheM [Enterobacteriaceae b